MGQGKAFERKDLPYKELIQKLSDLPHLKCSLSFQEVFLHIFQSLISEVKSFMFGDVCFKEKLETGPPQRYADSTKVLISTYAFITSKTRRCLPLDVLQDYNVNSLVNS